MDPLAVLRAHPDPVLVVDGAARLVWANATAEAAFGWLLEELQGRCVDFLCHDDDLPTALASLASVQSKDVGTVVELRLRDRSGSYRTYELRGRDATADTAVGGIVLALRDVTERARWSVAGGDGELYRALLDHAPAITLVLDGDGRVRGASRALTGRLGRDLETTLGHHLRELVTRADAMTVEAELALAVAAPGRRSFEVAFTARDGGTAVPMSVTVVNLLDDRTVEGLVVSAVDVTALAESRARLQHLADHDPLTGLANRSALAERLDRALSADDGSEVSLLYCDLDGFKAVNDRHGHLAGDHLLRVVADRLRSATRGGDTVARMGGDEFVVLVEPGGPGAVDALRRRVAGAMAAPVELAPGVRVTLGVTVGAATAGPSSDADDLIGRADAAMYAAKRRRAGGDAAVAAG